MTGSHGAHGGRLGRPGRPLSRMGLHRACDLHKRLSGPHPSPYTQMGAQALCVAYRAVQSIVTLRDIWPGCRSHRDTVCRVPH